MFNALTRVLGRGLTETRDGGLGQLDAYLDYLASGGSEESWSGAKITTTTAMRHEAVWACVTVRSNSLAQLPIITYRVREDGGKDRATNHYLYDLLRHKVNEYLTAFAWKRLMEMWVCIFGNAYCLMEVSGRGQTVGLYPWHPSRVEVKWEDYLGSLIPFYYFRPDKGDKIRQPYFHMVHLRGPGTDGFNGLSPIQEHKQTIGLGLAVQEHGARFFRNGASLRGILSPKAGAPTIPKDQLDLIKERWKESYGGLSNAHKTAFLPTGLDYQPVGVTMADAQYADIAQLNVPQICRIFGVPPHKVFDLIRSTNNNIEQQDIEYRLDYQGPEIVNWEAELNGTLLSDFERNGIYIEFLMNALMRADAAARSEYYTKALAGAPWMTQDDVRKLESMNPMGTKEAQVFPVTNNAPGPQFGNKPDGQGVKP